MEWQLTAFAWDKENPKPSEAERQKALRDERRRWNKYAQLDRRIIRTTNAFENTRVAARISEVEKLQQLRREWNTMADEARKLGRKRNAICHMYTSWSAGKVLRVVGRPWSEQCLVNEAEDNTLIGALGKLAIEIGKLTTEIGHLFPFADQDQIITLA